jgi:serpin B
MEKIVQANTAFAIDLFRKLAEKNGNVVFSPFNIFNCLIASHEGAGGNNQEEIARVLHLSSKNSPLHQSFKDLHRYFREIQSRKSVILRMTNAFWIQTGFKFKKDFIKLCRDYYKSDIFSVEYEKNPEKCRLKINKWVAKQTKNNIRNILLLGTIDEFTRWIITNAIYFNGNWLNQFAAYDTKDDVFWQSSKKKLKVKMMFQKNDFGYKETADLHVLEMPYVGKDLSMIILLPQRLDGLPKLEEELSSDILREWTSDLRSGEVKVFIPRFDVKAKYNLNGALNSLGMKEAFTDKADFSGMTDEMIHWISEIMHETFVRVHEEGTEAAAATAALYSLGVSSREVSEFRADHPFLFIIRENITETILFMGRVWEPKENSP